jgi:hypothetical protein
MATKASRVYPAQVTDGFDVTCLIGRVSFGEGDMTPVEAAMRLIGRHNAEGEYSFPHEDGGTTHVTVVIEPFETRRSEEPEY